MPWVTFNLTITWHHWEDPVASISDTNNLNMHTKHRSQFAVIKTDVLEQPSTLPSWKVGQVQSRVCLTITSANSAMHVSSLAWQGLLQCKEFLDLDRMDDIDNSRHFSRSLQKCQNTISQAHFGQLDALLWGRLILPMLSLHRLVVRSWSTQVQDIVVSVPGSFKSHGLLVIGRNDLSLAPD